MLKNTSSSYGLIAKLFHWLMGLVIIGMLIVGFYMTSMDPSDDKWQLYFFHKSIGVIALVLVGLRLLWRVINTTLDLPVESFLIGKNRLLKLHISYYMFVCL